jgi:hypothetical protein
MELYSIKTRLLPTTLSFLATLLLLSAAVVEAKVLFYDGCGYFSDEDGVEGNKICDTDFPMEVVIKLKKPVEKEGTTWRWKVRTIRSRNVELSGSLNNLIFYESYVDRLSKPEQSSHKGKVYSPEIAEGYTVRFYAGQGELKWKKTIEGKGWAISGVSSYDGSTFALLTGCDGADCSNMLKTHSRPNILTVYDNKGAEFMSFPTSPGLCRIVTLNDFWMSRRGQYMLVPCVGEGSSKFPYFLKPKERLFWKAEKYYMIAKRRVSLAADDWPDSDEDSGRVEVIDLEVSDPAAPNQGMNSTGPAYDLDLSQVGWSPLRPQSNVRKGAPHSTRK